MRGRKTRTPLATAARRPSDRRWQIQREIAAPRRRATHADDRVNASTAGVLLLIASSIARPVAQIPIRQLRTIAWSNILVKICAIFYFPILSEKEFRLPCVFDSLPVW